MREGGDKFSGGGGPAKGHAEAQSRRETERNSALPARQNRRTPMIEAALAPSKAEFSRASLDRLQKALALIVGTEAMIVFRDVLQLDEKEAREVKRWAIRVLIEAARGVMPGFVSKLNLSLCRANEILNQHSLCLTHMHHEKLCRSVLADTLPSAHILISFSPRINGI